MDNTNTYQRIPEPPTSYDLRKTNSSPKNREQLVTEVRVTLLTDQLNIVLNLMRGAVLLYLLWLAMVWREVSMKRQGLMSCIN